MNNNRSVFLRPKWRRFFLIFCYWLHFCFQSCAFQNPQRRRSSPPCCNQFDRTTCVLQSTGVNISDQSRTWNLQRRTTVSAQQDDRRRPRQKMKPMPITGYDAEAIEKFYDRRPLQVGWRLNSFGLPILGMFNW
jgi:hypothetical protein